MKRSAIALLCILLASLAPVVRATESDDLESRVDGLLVDTHQSVVVHVRLEPLFVRRPD